MPQYIRAFKCTAQGTPANLTRNPVLGGFGGQESREGYGYTSINTTGVETGCPNRSSNNLGGRASSLNLEGGPVNGGVGSTNREGGTLAGR